MGPFAKRGGIDIGCQDGDVPSGKVGDHPVQQDGDGIRFLAGRATRAPDPQPLLPSPSGVDKRRENMRLQGLETLLLPKKVGFTDGQMADQRLGLLLCQLRRYKPADARLRIGETEIAGGADNPPLQVAPALFRKVQAEAESDEFAALGQ